MAVLKLVETEKELIGLKQLQTNNLRRLIGEEEAMKEGFVTSEYELSLLQKMHDIHPSIIVKEGEEVVGYTIVTNKDVLGEHPELDHLFQTLDTTSYNGSLLKNENYILVGQVCVGKSHRGQGWVAKMYEFYKNLHISILLFFSEFYVRYLVYGIKFAVLPQRGQALIIAGIVCVHIWIECMSFTILTM